MFRLCTLLLKNISVTFEIFFYFIFISIKKKKGELSPLTDSKRMEDKHNQVSLLQSHLKKCIEIEEHFYTYPCHYHKRLRKHSRKASLFIDCCESALKQRFKLLSGTCK